MARNQIEERIMIPRYIKGEIFKACGGICAHCGKELDFMENFTLDHIIPLYKGGRNDRSNYAALCGECNAEKADDILDPVEYYKYLPEKRKADVKEMFEKYLREVDCLGYDNLFDKDQFMLRAAGYVMNRKSHALMPVPMPVNVKKLRRQDAFAWLQYYKQLLPAKDRVVIVKVEQELDDPYYEVTQNGKSVMVFSTHFENAHIAPGKDTQALFIDYFIHPNVKWQTGITCYTMNSILRSLFNKIQNTFMYDESASLIEIGVQTPAADKYATETLDAMVMEEQNVWTLFSRNALPTQGQQESDMPIIRGASAIMFNGSISQYAAISKECSGDTRSEYISNNMQNMYEPIKKRLDADTKHKAKTQNTMHDTDQEENIDNGK